MNKAVACKNTNTSTQR